MRKVMDHNLCSKKRLCDTKNAPLYLKHKILTLNLALAMTEQIFVPERIFLFQKSAWTWNLTRTEYQSCSYFIWFPVIDIVYLQRIQAIWNQTFKITIQSYPESDFWVGTISAIVWSSTVEFWCGGADRSGGDRLSDVSPFLVLSTLFWATPGPSFWATKLPVYIFMAREVYESDHKTLLHRSNGGHFLKKFSLFASAGALLVLLFNFWSKEKAEQMKVGNTIFSVVE